VGAAVAAGSVGDALGAAADALAAAGVDTPRLDAELLLTAATGIDRARLWADPEAGVDATAARRFGAMVRRRVNREPVAYILGRRGFRRIEVAVDRRVLIPRPETELLVEVALELRPRKVLDVGTGSGAVALALADELPATDVVATDTSAEALAIARANAERLGLAERVRLEAGTIPSVERFDLLVANLPYVAAGDWGDLAPEITRHEPRESLVAGPTGLEAIDSLLDRVRAAGGPAMFDALALEVGAGQAPAVAELARRAGYGWVQARRDLAGIERVIIARRASG
jgi:release factor glutamine methyltransferase